MNSARRKELQRAADLCQEVIDLESAEGTTVQDLAGFAADAKGIVESCRDEEQEYFDNMPEGFQNADRGSNAQSAIDAMEEAIGHLETIESTDETTTFEDLQSEAQEAVEGIDTAISG